MSSSHPYLVSPFRPRTSETKSVTPTPVCTSVCCQIAMCFSTGLPILTSHCRPASSQRICYYVRAVRATALCSLSVLVVYLELPYVIRCRSLLGSVSCETCMQSQWCQWCLMAAYVAMWLAFMSRDALQPAVVLSWFALSSCKA